MSGPVESFVERGDGRRIRVLAWPVDAPVGAVQIAHGMSEHVGRYDLLAEALNAAGYAAFGHDHIGHGRSDGARGVLPDFKIFVDDLAAVRAESARWTGVEAPPFLVGHSMGGLIAIRLLQGDGARDAPGVVISAPWLGTRVRIPPVKRGLAALLRVLAPELPISNDFDPTALTRDPERQRRYVEDELVHHRISAGLFHRVRAAQEEACGQPLPEPGPPILLLVPTADRVTDPETSLAWGRARGDRVTVEPLEGVPHEPFNDTARNEIFRRLVQWMDARRAP